MFTESVWKKSGLEIAGREGHQQEAEEYCTKENFAVGTLKQTFRSANKFTVSVLSALTREVPVS
jgi:hypothetical protein